MADGSLSQFKATLARRQARRDKNNGKFNHSDLNYEGEKTEYNFPKPSKSELESLKSKIRKDIRDKNKKELLFFLILLGIVILLILISCGNLS